MDFKSLMQKLEIIDKKQNLMEAEKKETTWTDKSGKKHPATQVKGDKYTGKEAEKESKKKEVDESIAQALLREFGLGEKVTLNPDGSVPPTKTVNGVTMADNSGATKGAAPAAGAPAAGGEWKPTPEQEKWLGGANRQDPYILNRMPGAKPPVSYFKDPGDQALAKQMKFPAAAAPAATPAAGAPAASPTATPAAAAPAASPTATPAAAPAATKPAEVPAGINPETGEKYDDGTSAPLQLPPGAAPEAGMSVAGDKTAKPAAAKPGADGAVGQDLAKMGVTKQQRLDQAYIDKTLGPGYKAGSAEANLALQAQMKKQGGSAPAAGSAAPAAKPDELTAVKKNAGVQSVQPDQKPGLDASGRANAATDPRIAGNAPSQVAAAPGAGGGRGGQGGPTADQLAQAQTAPAAAPKVAAAPAAAAPAAGGPTTKTTTTNQTVSGTMKMGKPDGPIQYNGKTVNPGDPEYAAASQALIASSEKSKAMSRPRGAPAGYGNTKTASAGGYSGQGAASTDFESLRTDDDAILERIRNAFRF